MGNNQNNNGSKRILWVEDDANQRDSIKDLLEILGYQGDVVENGQQALAQLEVREYDILFTDIGMPVMNGWQLIEHVKAKHGDKIKIAIVSGWANKIDSNEQASHGIHAVVSKPFQMTQLRDLLS